MNSDGSNMLIAKIEDFVASGAAESSGMATIVSDVARALQVGVTPDQFPRKPISFVATSSPS